MNAMPEDFVYPPGYVQPETIEEVEDNLKKLTYPVGSRSLFNLTPGKPP